MAMEGDAVCGILSATYGNHVTETFDTWRDTALAQWNSEGMGPRALTHEVDSGPRSWPVALSIGGCVFDVNPQNGDRVAGIRAPPHSIDVYAYKEQRGETVSVPSTAARKVARDFYQESNSGGPTNSRRKLPDAEKETDRAELRPLQGKKGEETNGKYARVLAERDARLTSDAKVSGSSSPSPSAAPSEA